MVRESDAPGMYLSSRSKAAAAAMLGGVRGADGGGRDAGRWAVYKGRRGESDDEKSGTTAAGDAAKIQQKQQWYDPRTRKISPHFIPHPLTSLNNNKRHFSSESIRKQWKTHTRQSRLYCSNVS